MTGDSRYVVAGVIMARQVSQVGLQETENVRTIAGSEILPVFGLQTVCRGECLLGVNNETGKSAGGLNVDNAHVEVRRRLVEGVAVHEGVVDRGGVGVPALVEVEFAEVAVYAGLVTARAVAREVFHGGIGAAEV